MNILELERQLKEKTKINWTIGVSTLLSPRDPAKGIRELLEELDGLRRIEIALAKQLDEEEETVKQLINLREKHGLDYSVHTPFLYDNLAHPKKQLRQIHVEEGKKAIDLAARLKARYVVFHPGELFFRNNLPPVEVFKSFKRPRESYLESSLESFQTLSSHGASLGVNMLIENLPHGLCDRAEELEYLLSNIDNSSFILDIGHANISRSLEELLELKPQFFHFNDNDGKVDDHRQMGKGAINLTYLLNRMASYDGDKTIIFELYSLEDVLGSLRALENYLED